MIVLGCVSILAWQVSNLSASPAPGGRVASVVERDNAIGGVGERRVAADQLAVSVKEDPSEEEDDVHDDVDAAASVDSSEREPSLPVHALPRHRTAVYAVLTQLAEGYRKQNLVLNALLMKCSAMCYDSQLPFHMLYAGENSTEDDATMELLRSFGWVVEDMTSDVEKLKSIHKPVYDEKEAKVLVRWWSHQRELVSGRKDGWATYLKFWAWRVQDYDLVLVADLDVLFAADPNEGMDAVPANVIFMTSLEKRGDLDGYDSHLMILRPDQGVYDELVLRAKLGEYVPYTNTDQDVLESLFPPRLYAVLRGAEEAVPHAHVPATAASGIDGRCPLPEALPEGWQPRTCADVLRICNLTGLPSSENWERLQKCA